MDNYTLPVMLYTSAQMALLSCIRYWLYQDNLRVSARRMYAALFAIACGAAAVWVYTGGIPGVSFDAFRIVMALCMFVLSCFIIKEPFFKHAYTYSFIMVYDCAIELTAVFVQQQLTPGPRSWLFIAVSVLIIALSFIPAARNLKRMIRRISAAANDRLWGWLCVISFSFVFMNLLFTFPLPRPVPVRALISRYLMVLGVIGLYAATTKTVEIMHEAAAAKAERDLAARRITMQQSYYDRMIAQMEDVRRARHDLRHHKAALEALIKSGNTAALSAYIESSPETAEAVPVTGNLAADSILLYYMDAARALGLQMETNLAIGGKTPLSDPDLCVILGNLLENAVDAQGYLPPEKRCIRVTAKADETRLTLAVDNRFDGTLQTENGAYLSRKAGAGHGLGISSVQAVCEKYGGVLQLEAEGDMFMAGVVIGL